MTGLLAGIGLFYWGYLAEDDPATGVWQKIMAAILIALAGATAGKIVGLVWARHRRLALQSDMVARFPARPPG